MTKALLSALLCVVSAAHAQTWNGNTSSNWNTAVNWTPANVPTSTSAVILNNATAPNQPQLQNDVTIASLNMTAGKLDLGGFTLTATGAVTLDGDSLTSGKIVGANIVNFADTRVIGKLTLQKTGTTGTGFHYGNNKVYADSLILLWGGGTLNLQYGSGIPDSVFGTLAITTSGTGTLALGRDAGLYVQGNLAMRNPGGATYDLATNATPRRIGGSLIWDAAYSTPSLTMNNVVANGSSANGPFRCVDGSITSCSFGGSFSLMADSNQDIIVLNSSFLGASNVLAAGSFGNFQNNIFNTLSTGTTTVVTANKTAGTYDNYWGGNRFRNNFIFQGSTLPGSGGQVFRTGYYGADSVLGSATYKLTNNASLSAGTGGGAQYVGGDLTLDADGSGHDIAFSSASTHRIGGSLVAQGFVANTRSFSLNNIVATGIAPTGTFQSGTGNITNCTFNGDFTLLVDSAQNFNLQGSQFLGANNYFRAGEFQNFVNNIFGQTGAGTATHIAANKANGPHYSYMGGNKIRNNWLLAGSSTPNGSMNFLPGYYSADSCLGNATIRLSSTTSLNSATSGGTQYVGGNLALDADGSSHSIAFSNAGAHVIGGNFLAQNFGSNTGTFSMYNTTAAGTALTGTIWCGGGGIYSSSLGGDLTLIADSGQNFNLQNSQFLGANNFFRAGWFYPMTNNVFGQTGTGLTTHIAANNLVGAQDCYIGGNKIRNNWLFVATPRSGAGAVTLRPGYYGADSCFGTATWRLSAASSLIANQSADTSHIGGDLVLDATGGSHAVNFTSSGAQHIGGSLIAQNFSGNTGTLTMYDITATGTAATGLFQCGNGTIVNCSFGGDFTLMADSAQNFPLENSQFLGANNFFRAGEFYPLRNNIFGQTGTGTTTHVAANKSATGKNCYMGNNRIRNNWLLAASSTPSGGTTVLYPGYYGADSCFGTATWKLTNNANLEASQGNDTSYTAGNLVIDADGGSHSINFSSTGAQRIGGSLQAANFSANMGFLALRDIMSTGTAASGTFQCGGLSSTINNCSFVGDFTILVDSAQNFDVVNSSFLGANNTLRSGGFYTFTGNVFGQAGTGTSTIISANKTAAAFPSYDGGNRYRGGLTCILYAPAGGSQSWFQSYYTPDSIGGPFTLLCSGLSSVSLAHNTAAYFGGSIVINNTGTGTVQSIAGNPMTMYGTDTATFSYTGTEPVIRRLRMNKMGGLKLFSPLRIHTTVVLDTGVILTTAANMLTVLDGATATGLQRRSFVDGPMKKIGNDIFSFPVGDSNFAAPIGITAPATATDEFVARYYRIPPHSAGYDTSLHDASIKRLSSLEYWTLERTAGTAGVKVTLSHDTARSGLITNQASLLVAHWKGATPSWQSEGNGAVTGNMYTGTVQSAATVNTFSPFTLGSTSQGTPLPMVGIRFSAMAEGSAAMLRWTAETEEYTARYTIERSSDGDRYEHIGAVAADANGPAYEYRDASPLAGRNFYRIAAHDMDGSVRYSVVRSLTFVTGGAVRIFPNPAGEYLWVEAPASATAVVYAADGRMLLRGNAPGRLVIGGLPGGVYFVRVLDARGELLLTERVVKE